MSFTLAEVLIVLGIIGLIADMTIPTLVSSYRKKIVETKLLKFYSTMNQAIALSEIDNGNKQTWDVADDSDGDFTNLSGQKKLDWFNKYLAKYIKILRTEIPTASTDLDIYFIDGSKVKITYRVNDYNFYINAAKPENKSVSGKDYFIFGFYPIYSLKEYDNKGIEPYVPRQYDGTREFLLTYPSCYAKLIQLNSWKIPEDYPIKF